MYMFSTFQIIIIFPFLFKKKGVDQINSDMRLAEEALKSMDLLCGIFPKFWKKSGGFKEDDAIWGDQKVRAMYTFYYTFSSLE